MPRFGLGPPPARACRRPRHHRDVLGVARLARRRLLAGGHSFGATAEFLQDPRQSGMGIGIAGLQFESLSVGDLRLDDLAEIKQRIAEIVVEARLPGA